MAVPPYLGLAMGRGACRRPGASSRLRFRDPSFAGARRGAGMASKTQDGLASRGSVGGGRPGGRAAAGGRQAGTGRRLPGRAGEAPGWAEAVRRAWPQVSGPLITLAAVLLLEVQFVAKNAVSDLGAFLVIAVVYSAFLGGVRSGLISAAIMVAYYTHRLITPEALVHASARERLIVVAVISPLVALISAYLKKRLDRIRERDRAARAEAEAAERRSRFLAEASRALSASLDHEVTLANLAALAVPEISDYCIIHVRGEDGVIRQVAAAHADPEKEPLLRELERRLTPDPDDPAGVVARVLRDHEPVLIAEVPE